MSMTAAIFAAVFVGMFVAHQLADHWVQTGHQAAHKHQRDMQGRLACLGHVTTYTLTTAATVALLGWLLELHLTVAGFVAGQLVSAVTHYWADRRFTLAWLCTALGKADFYRLGAPRSDRDDNPTLGTGSYALDQSWHYLWLGVAAMLTALL